MEKSCGNAPGVNLGLISASEEDENPASVLLKAAVVSVDSNSHFKLMNYNIVLLKSNS